MKSIKDLREQYDLITEKEEAESRKLTALVRAGLFDAKKLPALKKAMEKGVDKMSAAEKRMLINLLDSLMSQVLSNQPVYQKVKQNVQRMDEAKTEYLSKLDPRFDKKYSEKDIPTVLILKRKAVRVYPDFQKVALYYAQAIDKYVSIPFGEINVGGLNEATGNNSTSNTSSTTTTSRSSTGTVVLPSSRRRVTLGKKKSTIAVTNMRNTIKGMRPIDRHFFKLGLKTRRKYILGKNKTYTPITENYYSILQSLREDHSLNEGLAGKIITKLIGKSIGAADDAAKIATKGATKVDDAANVANKSGKKLTAAEKTAARQSKISKLEKSGKAAKRAKTTKTSKLTKLAAAGAGAAEIASNLTSGGSGSNLTSREWRKPADQGYQFGLKPTTSSSFQQKNPTDDAQRQRDYVAQKKANQAMASVNESVFSQMKNMVENDTSSIQINYGNNPITINNGAAKKIINLHESLNRTNKKKIETMLNESATSFNKVLTFALRY